MSISLPTEYNTGIHSYLRADYWESWKECITLYTSGMNNLPTEYICVFQRYYYCNYKKKTQKRKIYLAYRFTSSRLFSFLFFTLLWPCGFVVRGIDKSPYPYI